jgi:hypothetical protein
MKFQIIEFRFLSADACRRYQAGTGELALQRDKPRQPSGKQQAVSETGDHMRTQVSFARRKPRLKSLSAKEGLTVFAKKAKDVTETLEAGCLEPQR